MKKMSVLFLVLCMMISLAVFGDMSTAKATNYLTAEQNLDDLEHDVYEAVIKMLELACGHKDGEYGYEDKMEIGEYLPGEPSEYRILELSVDVRENAADLAIIRFVRIGENGGKEDFYYFLYTETFWEEPYISQDSLQIYSAAYSGQEVMFYKRSCGHLGEYQSILLTEQGIETMASTQGAGYINRINRALDEYWEKQ